MDKKPFLENYTGQTTDRLIELAERYRVDSIVLAFDSAILKKLNVCGEGALSQEEFDVLAVEAMEREVNSGGYHQFFLNSSRYYAPILLRSLSKIGCPKTHEITEAALRIVGTDDPDRLEEITTSDSPEADELIDTLYSRCDVPYYHTGEDIAARLFEFIVRNRSAIDLSSVAT